MGLLNLWEIENLLGPDERRSSDKYYSFKK